MIPLHNRATHRAYFIHTLLRISIIAHHIPQAYNGIALLTLKVSHDCIQGVQVCMNITDDRNFRHRQLQIYTTLAAILQAPNGKVASIYGGDTVPPYLAAGEILSHPRCEILSAPAEILSPDGEILSIFAENG